MRIPKLNKDQVIGIIRHTLTFVGGILTTMGTIDASMSELLIGSIMGVIGSIWSIKAKY